MKTPDFRNVCESSGMLNVCMMDAVKDILCGNLKLDEQAIKRSPANLS